MFTVDELRSVLEAHHVSIADSGFQVRYVVIDSRQINHGSESMFVAIKGLRTDGHKFVAQAYRGGVRTFVVSDEDSVRGLEDSNVFVVNDTVRALQQLAIAHRNRYDIPCIGITGSNGKTLVKEWLAQLLLPDFDIVRSPRSYNSQIGVPLSVLQIRPNHELGLFEAGISQTGEMRNLEEVIKPQIGVITNIGDAHDSGFRDRDQKLGEKLDLFEHSDVIIFPADDAAIEDAIRQRYGSRKLFSWGVSDRADLRVYSVDRGNVMRVKYTFGDETMEVQIPFTDSASLKNALTCALVMHVLHVPGERIMERLARLQPLSQRLEMHAIGGKSLLINDTYSLDLVSLKVGLETLNQHSIGREKVLILTDMDAQHIANYEEIARLVEANDVDVLFGIGSAIGEISNYARAAGHMAFYASMDEFVEQKPWEAFGSAVILLKGARSYGLEEIVRHIRIRSHSAVLEIDLNAMLSNLQYFVSRLEHTTQVIAMVKAAAYGSGSIEVGKFLEHNNVDRLGVAYVDEGVELRQAGVTLPILVLNPDDESLVHLLDFRLEPEVYTLELLRRIAALAQARQQKIKVHLKLDTGMHRLGFEEGDIPEVAAFIMKHSFIVVESIFTHLAAADDPSEEVFTRGQFSRFDRMYEQITAQLGYLPMRHVLNSHGVLNYPEHQYEAVRLGIGLYGAGTGGADRLRPVHTFTGRVSQVRMLEPGETVGYGRAFRAQHPMKIATINVGYADGLPRAAGNGGYAVRIGTGQAPIIGRVCMDMCMVDVTGLDNVASGESVEIFGPHIRIEALAEACDTIPYEILTGISPRIPRIFRFD